MTQNKPGVLKGDGFGSKDTLFLVRKTETGYAIG
jgi:hypothetical protein